MTLVFGNEVFVPLAAQLPRTHNRRSSQNAVQAKFREHLFYEVG
jgi:hypothetical protein